MGKGCAVVLTAAALAVPAVAEAWAAPQPRQGSIAGVLAAERSRSALVRLHRLRSERKGTAVVFGLRRLHGCDVKFARLIVRGRRRRLSMATVRRALRRGLLRRDVRARHASLVIACVVAYGAVAPSTLGDATPFDHIETWAYDDSASSGWCNGGYGASPTLVRSWLTYAETNCGPNADKALTDCHDAGTTHCTVLTYLNPNVAWPGNPIPRGVPVQENWWLHQPGYTDFAHRLADVGSYGTGYLLNQSSPAVQQRVQSYLRASFDSWDGVMMDDFAGSTTAQFWGTGYSSSEEISTDSEVLAGHEQMARVLTHSSGAPFLQVDNGINVNPDVKPTFPLLNDPSSVVGLVAEGEPWENGVQPYYSTLLDYLAYVDSRRGNFIALLSYDENGRLEARRFQEGTVLLGYAPGHVVDWADLEQANLDLAVWPEEGIYPTQPIESMRPPGGNGCLSGDGVVCPRGGHNDLEVMPGVYRREFGACYDHGVLFGPCAVLVNDTSSSVTVSRSWLAQSYSHQITISGGDVQSGGTIDTAGATFTPGSTAVPADDALLLSQ
jgi:hypothetical protein